MELYFQHHSSSLQCHMIFRNHNNMLNWCSKNISDYYQCWKQLCCFIFWWKLWYILFFWILWWIKFKRTAFVWYINVLIHYKCILINLMCLYWKKVLHSFKRQNDILQLYGNVIYDIYCSILKVIFHMLRRHIIVTCVHLLGRWRYKFITYIKSP